MPVLCREGKKNISEPPDALRYTAPGPTGSHARKAEVFSHQAEENIHRAEDVSPKAEDVSRAREISSGWRAIASGYRAISSVCRTIAFGCQAIASGCRLYAPCGAKRPRTQLPNSIRQLRDQIPNPKDKPDWFFNRRNTRRFCADGRREIQIILFRLHNPYFILC